MLILASQSPRRQALLKAMDLKFQIKVKPVDETFPPHIPIERMAEYLAEKKADAFDFSELPKDATLITCDTTVIIDDEVLGKAETPADATAMLNQLSGRKHRVMTGVCLKSVTQKILFTETTTVHFKLLSAEQIRYYVDTYKPFDKAGAYGIQEWIGLVGIERIEGCYYNVMGLPTARLAEKLQEMKYEEIYEL
ncbi:MAG: Maf family protein [Bacteroidales bacterium]|jgi:septum formation protein|nr:Maf family protein [Bacteroidales bacterium]